MDTWCIWNLTGGIDGGRHVTDVSNASRTMLMDLETLDWDDDLLSAIGVPRSMLPSIEPSSRRLRRGQGHARRHPGRRRPGRPAGRDLRPGRLRRRRGEEHVRHRVLHAAEHGHRAGPLEERGCSPPWDGSSATSPRCTAWRASIAITGALVQWLRDNLGIISTLPGDRGARRDGRGQRRHVLRAGVLGPVRAVLARRRARRDRGDDPLRQQGPHRPRHPRSHRVADPRGARRHGTPTPASRSRSSRSTAAWSTTSS